jgi:hypothetical protein
MNDPTWDWIFWDVGFGLDICKHSTKLGRCSFVSSITASLTFTDHVFKDFRSIYSSFLLGLLSVILSCLMSILRAVSAASSPAEAQDVPLV